MFFATLGMTEVNLIPIRFQKLCSPCLFSAPALFKRFQRFEKPLYDMKDRSLKANWYQFSILNSQFFRFQQIFLFFLFIIVLFRKQGKTGKRVNFRVIHEC